MCTFICNVFVFVIVIVIVIVNAFVFVLFACPLGLAFQTGEYLFIGFQNCISERIGKIMESLNCHRLSAVRIER